MLITHPKPRVDALRQYGGAALALVMALAGLGTILAGLSNGRLLLLIPAGVMCWLLIAPVIMLSAASPALEITDAALIVRSRVWGRHALPWASIRDIRDNPLLPPEEGEKVRRAVVGRANYAPERGKLIVAPALPLPFRFLGRFAGVGFTGAVALSSRAHTPYDAAVAAIEARWNAATAALQSSPEQP